MWAIKFSEVHVTYVFGIMLVSMIIVNDFIKQGSKSDV
jgi:hypothetical protein